MTMGCSRCRWAMLAVGALLVPGMAGAQQADQPERTHAVVAQPAVPAGQFMVVAAHPQAAEVGYDVLKRGGSAADAAVAVQFMLNLVGPQRFGEDLGGPPVDPEVAGHASARGGRWRGKAGWYRGST